VGSLAVQLAKAFGAGRVIATASSEEKRRLALELGADAAVDVNAEELHDELVEANGGAKVDVVLELAGGRVFDHSLRALAPFGRLVVYGIASRDQTEVPSGYLMSKSKSVVGFYLGHCIGRRELMEEPLADLFERAARGELRPRIGATYPLSQVRRAHEELQGRRDVLERHGLMADVENQAEMAAHQSLDLRDGHTGERRELPRPVSGVDVLLEVPGGLVCGLEEAGRLRLERELDASAGSAFEVDQVRDHA
jgi:hypothetical protein